MTAGSTVLEVVEAVALGLALAAAVGLRIFVPLLALSAAAMAGIVQLGEGTTWIGSLPALIAFTVAAVILVGLAVGARRLPARLPSG